MSRASASTREICQQRCEKYSGGLCEICGERRPGSLHQRVTPGHGGRRGDQDKAWANNPANHLLICGSGTTYCHGLITNPYAFGTTREHVERMGWVVRRNGGVDPATVPVYVSGGRWVRYTEDGEVVPSEPPE